MPTFPIQKDNTSTPAVPGKGGDRYAMEGGPMVPREDPPIVPLAWHYGKNTNN